MLGRLALISIRHRRWVFFVTVVLTALAVLGGGAVSDRLKSQGFDDPNSEAAKTSAGISKQFNTGNPNITFLVEPREGDVDDPEVKTEAEKLVAQVRALPDFKELTSYWTTPGSTGLRSVDGSSGLVLARVLGDDDDVAKRNEALVNQFNNESPAVAVSIGGITQINHEVNSRIQHDVPRAELISLPIVLLLLVFVFGGLVAALVPILLGVLAILGALLVLRVLTGVTDVSIYAINITTMLGLGLAIDYSLFIISRYREEMASGLDREQAIVRAVETGGRTVLFSAVAVAISLSALAAFPLYFLTSIAYAGVSVVFFAALIAVTFLPALLASIGSGMDKLSIFHRKATVDEGQGFWGRIGRFVMKRPLIVGLCTLAFLGVIGSPFINANFGTADDRALPMGSPARTVSEKIRNEYSSSDSYPVTVLAMNLGDPLSRTADLATFGQALSKLPNVARVDAITGTYVKGDIAGPASAGAGLLRNDNATVINVYVAKDPTGDPGEQVVRNVRAVSAPFDVGVTGVTATTVDSNHVLAQRLPYAGAGIAVVMLIVLFLLTGSVVLPIKTVLLSMVSLTATFGAMVWVFQEGHLGSLLNISPTEITDSTNPLLMFGIAFGLSMDYAVFLLARIKEEHDKGLSTEQAVVRGLEKSGRVVTAAAALIAVVFFAFGTSSVVFLKMIGMGLALAILVDATIIRGLLVPSFMRLLGKANWWSPSFLRPVHRRFGINESVPKRVAQD